MSFKVYLETYPEDITVEIEIPEFELKISSEHKEVEIVLPKLPPEEYTITLKVIKDGEVLDIRNVRFLVKALDVVIGTLETPKVIYKSGESVELIAKTFNLTMQPVDVNLSFRIYEPDGNSIEITAEKFGTSYRAFFTPVKQGTYFAKILAEKEGIRVVSQEIAFVLDRMSKLDLSVNVSEDKILVRVTSNDVPIDASVTLKCKDQNISKLASNGVVIFDRVCNEFEISAEKMFYEPASLRQIKTYIKLFIYDEIGNPTSAKVILNDKTYFEDTSADIMVEEGTYDLRIEKEGYIPVFAKISIKPGESNGKAWVRRNLSEILDSSL
ncbi:MAG: PEGA domain-containing protein [Archaeoglobaceae archaeon]